MVFLLATGWAVHHVTADHDQGEEKRGYRHRDQGRLENDKGGPLKPVNNPTFKEECGACHFAYQPALLPSGSWDKILGRLEDHFGADVELEPESKKIIADYVKANAAETSRAKRAVKIMRCLQGQIPIRITEIPYIQRKHRKISPDVFNRDTIGSRSNCSACHSTAEKGIYEDDFVAIPD